MYSSGSRLSPSLSVFHHGDYVRGSLDLGLGQETYVVVHRTVYNGLRQPPTSHHVFLVQVVDGPKTVVKLKFQIPTQAGWKYG